MISVETGRYASSLALGALLAIYGLESLNSSVSGMISASLDMGGLMPPVSYPKVSVKAWGALRTKAAVTPSTKFTADNIAILLDMANSKSASDNIVYPMRKLGLFSEEGGLTERGNKWRIDSSYGDACQEILDEIYPDELAGFTNSDGDPDVSQIIKWMQQKGHGQSSARQMAATYAMIAQKKLPEVGTAQAKQGNQNGTVNRSASRPKPKKELSEASAVEAVTPSLPEMGRASTDVPNIHLDIQIHIPVEASAEQIDQIFASMGKHLYRK